MMVCTTCNMRGEVIKEAITRSFYYEKCPACHGKAVVEPSQQILDDLECAEIERELNGIKKFAEMAIVKFWNGFEVQILISGYEEEIFNGKTKLEALRKAKECLDGRCAE